MTIAEKRKHHKPWREWPVGSKIAAIVAGAVVGLGLMTLFGFITMWLWNWIMPRIFGLPLISYWEGWGIIILSYILFHGKTGSRSISERRRIHKMRNRIKTLDEENGTEGEKSST
jgi:hypothetical protein